MRRLVAATCCAGAIAVIAGLGFAQEPPNPTQPRTAAAPGINAVSVEASRGGGARLLVEAVRVRNLPGSFRYPFDDKDVIVNDLGRDGDSTAGDGIYTASVQFDVAGLERQVTANVARLSAEKSAAPAERSTRFDPGAKSVPKTLSQLRTSQVLAERRFQALTASNARAALATFKLPAERRPAQILRFERLRGDARALLFGKLVPIDVVFLPKVSPAAVKPGRSLMITATEVVKDPARTFEPCGAAGNPDGIWSFKHLMTQMANTPQTGIQPEDFVMNWLNQSAANQPVNSFFANARPAYVAFLRNRWLAQSGGVKLDLNKAPFRLLAIVSRSDLGSAVGGYSGGSAGEARFVFGVLDPDNVCGPPPKSTVIFEYGINKASCSAKKAWIQDWFSLSSSGLVLGGSYNQKLETLTQSFVMAGANPGQLPNRNAISQIRTNDLRGGPWTLFEYQLRSSLEPDSGNLHNVTVKQNPDISFRQNAARIALLRQYLIDNQTALLNDSHIVPAVLPTGDPILGGESPTNNNIGFTWTDTVFAGPVNAAALAKYSIATCNGCHTGDTNTQFTHVNERSAAAASTLSTFLSAPGNPIEDDLERRQRMMANALNGQCFALPITATLPLKFVH